MSRTGITLLGPRHRPIDDHEVLRSWPDGPIALIRESGAAFPSGRPTVTLRLSPRWRSVLDGNAELTRLDRELRAALGDRQELYSLRLRHALGATAELTRARATPSRLRAAADALGAVRALDHDHLTGVRQLRDEFSEVLEGNDHLAHQRIEVAAVLADAVGLVLPGGHVGELLHLGQVFRLSSMITGPVLAWSAGAMVLGDQVLLFHDHDVAGPPPHQFLSDGWGLLPDSVILPDARRRLAVHDRARQRQLAQRLRPAIGILLDNRERLQVVDGDWSAGVRRLDHRPSGVDHGAP